MSTNKQTNNPSPSHKKNMGIRPGQMFLKKIYRLTNQNMKRCLTWLANYERNANQPKMWYHFSPVQVTIVKKSTNSKCWRGVEKKRILVHHWWECRLVQSLWKTVWRFLKNLKTKNSIAI